MRRAAVVVPVCSEQALILRRAQHLRFQPGFHSFPGGLIEAMDDRPAGPGPGPSDARCAALREMVEEVGVIPPHHLDKSDEDIRSNVLKEDDGESWRELAQNCDWSRWRYLGCWTTPEYAHLRFETHFFSCLFDRIPTVHTNDEVAQAWWITAADAQAAWRDGELPASPPVLAALGAAMDGHTVFEKLGTARDLLCAGSALRYLPLRAQTLPPASHTNCCLIGGEGHVFAVDPAPTDEGERAMLWEHLNLLAAQGEQLKGVVLTHLHHDHLGGAAWLAQHADVPVFASRRTAEDLAQGLGSGVSAGGFESNQIPHVSSYLKEGDMLPGGWRTLETPGHAHGHLCFWHEGTSALVAGDMIASGSTILIEPEQGDLVRYLESLERLAALQPSLIVPSHGMPIAQGQHALRALIEHRLMRERKTLQALQQLGQGDLSDLVAIAYDDTPAELWPLAELSLCSHLIKLEAEGRAESNGLGRWYVDGSPPAA